MEAVVEASGVATILPLVQLLDFLHAFTAKFRDDDSFDEVHNVHRAQIFCSTLRSLWESEMTTFRTQLHVIQSASRSPLLPVEEGSQLARRWAILDTEALPIRLGQYLQIATVLAFSGSPYTSLVQMEEWYRDVARQCLMIAHSPKAMPFYTILDTVKAAANLSTRPRPGHSVASGASLRFFVAATWQYCTSRCPLVVDPHHVLDWSWVHRLPCGVVWLYQDELAARMLRDYSQYAVRLVILDCPANPSNEFLKEVKRVHRRSSGSNNQGEMGHSLSVHQDFRLVLTTTVPVAWAQPSTFTVTVADRVETATSKFVLQDEAFRCARPSESQRLEECWRALQLAEDALEDAQFAVWHTAVFDAPQYSAVVTGRAAAEQRVATLRSELEALLALHEEYRLVAEVGTLLYQVDCVTTLPINAVGHSRANFHHYVTDYGRRLTQHLSEGTRHVTRIKSAATVAFVEWAGQALDCGDALLRRNALRVPEEQHATSLALHLINRFVNGSNRPVVTLWWLSQSAAVHHEAVVIPSVFVEYAATLLPPVTEEEVDLFARLQRLLLTFSSLRSLLEVPDERMQTADLDQFVAQRSQEQMIASRMTSMEDDVMTIAAKVIVALHTQPKAGTLVDPVGLAMALQELYQCVQASLRLLTFVCAEQKANAAGRLMADHSAHCAALEQQASDLLRAATGVNGEENPNVILSIRRQVAVLEKEKVRLIQCDPSERRGPPVVPMRSVDKLVEVCLPATRTNVDLGM
jgi:hypothetical protein